MAFFNRSLGLRISKVIEIENDPNGEYRVLIKGIRGGNQWAPMATFMASQNSGAFFYPEIGDEVVVGYKNNRYNKPIILGGLINSRQHPSFSPSSENNIKGIETRNGLQLVFDEEDKAISLKTPGGMEVVLSESEEELRLADANGNFIRMNKDGIEINSSKDLLLKANGDIDVDAGASIKMNATADYSVQGLNVSMTALVSFTASANANAELSASANTVIKGSLVQIN